jgi:flagellar basal-body rod modification protein FlgD
MAVAPISSTSTTSTSTGTASSAASQTLSTSYNTFLQLLTTQLRTQNPLEPMDAEKFTDQLVQYSAVEQQIKTNQNLEAILATSVSNAALGLVNYIGKQVTANSDVTMLKDGNAKWVLNAGAAAEDADVTIRNEQGATVYQGKVDLTSGSNTYNWNGATGAGGIAPSGSYSISVSAKDSSNKAVAISTKVAGLVTGIDSSTSQPFIKVNGTLVPLSNLLSVGE